MKHKENKSMVKAFQNVYEYLKKCGHKPMLNVMDNECSKAAKDYIQTKKKLGSILLNQTATQVNVSKQAMQTIKTASLPEDLTIQLCYELLLLMLNHPQPTLHLQNLPQEVSIQCA